MLALERSFDDQPCGVGKKYRHFMGCVGHGRVQTSVAFLEVLRIKRTESFEDLNRNGPAPHANGNQLPGFSGRAESESG